MKRVWLYLFIAISIAELVAVTFNLPSMRTISKPLILPALMGYFLVSVSTRNFYFLGALVFCWAGDVLLMFQGEELFFILGLIAFLIGHLFYMISYRRLRASDSSGSLMNIQKIRYSFPIALAGTGLVTILFPHLDGLKIPVVVYALVLTLMVLQALYRYGFTSKKSFALVFIGAIFFMASDSILAINKFLEPLPMASPAIMLTYIAAQYLIVEGVIQHHLAER